MNIKETIERMKAGEKIAVNCKTEGAAEIFLTWLDKEGFKWPDGDNLRTYIEWYKYNCDTCYTNYVKDNLTYEGKGWFLNNGYEVVEFFLTHPNCEATNE